MHRIFTLRILTLCAVVFGLPALQGCVGGGQPARLVDLYTIDYPPPQATAVLRPDLSVSVERFTVAQRYNGTAMVFQTEPYRLDQYESHRWKVSPADMITDALYRDLLAAGLFGTVYSYRSMEPSSYRLLGSVDDFLEVNDKDGRHALVTVHATLTDLTRGDGEKRVLFQRSYRFTEPVTRETASALAEGMSKAVAALSRALLDDIRSALHDAELKSK
jgi:ABC-type uncharacterized transport system auxiliary subunit